MCKSVRYNDHKSGTSAPRRPISKFYVFIYLS